MVSVPEDLRSPTVTHVNALHCFWFQASPSSGPPLNTRIAPPMIPPPAFPPSTQMGFTPGAIPPGFMAAAPMGIGPPGMPPPFMPPFNMNLPG